MQKVSNTFFVLLNFSLCVLYIINIYNNEVTTDGWTYISYILIYDAVFVFYYWQLSEYIFYKTYIKSSFIIQNAIVFILKPTFIPTLGLILSLFFITWFLILIKKEKR